MKDKERLKIELTHGKYDNWWVREGLTPPRNATPLQKLFRRLTFGIKISFSGRIKRQ